MRRAVLSSAWWALRDDASAMLAMSAVVAIGLAAATPGLVEAPRVALAPLADTPWLGTWSTLAVGANAAREQALQALSRTVWTGSLVVLVVAGLTIVALSVARAARRRSEVVVRRTVGASRRVLAAAAVVEGLILTVGGVAAGSILGFLPLAALALTAVVLLGALLPLGHTRARMPGADATGAGVPLIVPMVQFALGLLVIVAGTQLDVRVRPSIVAETEHRGTIITLRDTSPTALAGAMERLRADTAVQLISVSSPGTLFGLGPVDVIMTDCGRCSQGGIATPFRMSQATNHLVSADSFLAMGLRVAEGRALSDADRMDTTPVAVVSRYLAEREFEGGRALGRQLRVGGPNNWYRVVGVVEDQQFDGVGAGTVPQRRVFLSTWQHQARQLDVLVRSTGGDDRGRLETAGVATANVNGSAPEHEVRGREAAAAAWFARALTVEGWGGLLLAVIGIVTVMRMSVRSRLPELALRRAVGARRRHVWGRVAARGLAVILGGALLAWWVQPLATAAMARAVSGMPPADLFLARVPLAVLVAATLAVTLGSARRAARAAPVL